MTRRERSLDLADLTRGAGGAMLDIGLASTLKIIRLTDRQGTDPHLQGLLALGQGLWSTLPIVAVPASGDRRRRLHRHLHPQFLQASEQPILQPLLVLRAPRRLRAALLVLLAFVQHLV